MEFIPASLTQLLDRWTEHGEMNKNVMVFAAILLRNKTDQQIVWKDLQFNDESVCFVLKAVTRI